MKSKIQVLRPHLAILLLLAAVTVAVYSRILGHEFLVNWDDGFYVTGNEAIRGFSREHLVTLFSRFYVGNYAPIQMLSYLLDYELWGLRPAGYLLTNLLLHLVNGLLVYRLLLNIHGERLVAWVGAALFLLHPVQVESVAWISQRKNVLAMLFFLLAWEAYRYFRDSDGRYRMYAYIFSIVAFILALLSKSVAVILPAIIILDDACFQRQGKRLLMLSKIPYILVSVSAALLALQSQMPEETVWGSGGGRVYDYPGGSALSALYTMLPVFCTYLRLLILPAGLSAEYDPPIRITFDSTVAGSAVLLVSLVLLGVYLCRSDRKKGFWALFFVIGLLPVSQIIPLSTLMNDRYLYFPMLSVAALSGYVVAQLFKRPGKEQRMICFILLATVISAFSWGSFKRAGVWKDSVTLWSDAAEKSPGKSSVWERLGEAYHLSASADRERYRFALAAYARATELDPWSELPLYNAGIVYTAIGEYGKAQEVLGRLLDYYPDHVRSLVALGDSYRKQGKHSEAESWYRQAESLQPDALEVLLPAGINALELRKLDVAREYLLRAEAAEGNVADVAYYLACLESLAGRRDEGVAWLAEALKRGYQDKRTIQEDTRLSLVRTSPRFSEMITKLAGERTNGDSGTMMQLRQQSSDRHKLSPSEDRRHNR